MKTVPMSKPTKTYKSKAIFFFVLSMLATVGPILVFVIWAFVTSETHQKVVLSMTLIGAAILAALSLIQKLHLRSPVFLILIGLWFVLDKVMACIIVIALCTVLDELVFWPLYKSYSSKFKINKEIDKRLPPQESQNNG